MATSGNNGKASDQEPRGARLRRPDGSEATTLGPPTLRVEHGVLGTPLAATTYADLARWCHWRARQPGTAALEFTNTHVVTLRRTDRRFRELTDAYDYFIPDATPLIWCMNRQGAGLRERVYGPVFLRECFRGTTDRYRHYLLGGSAECARRLTANLSALNPQVRIVGGFQGRCSLEGRLEGGADRQVLEEIERLSPDFIWVGLGTPKQDAWVRRNKAAVARGVILSVGFAFDVNAGVKRDAPPWMQRTGLTWLFRMASEPRRLLTRYLKFNSLFLWHLAADGLRGRAFALR